MFIVLSTGIGCPDPDAVVNARYTISGLDDYDLSRTNNATFYGNIITYTCSAGFEFMSPDFRERHCTESGALNGTAPVCRGKCQ